MGTKYREIDLDTWNMAEAYRFFLSFPSAAHGFSMKIEAQNMMDYAKSEGRSFFICTLYAFMSAVNRVPELRQRIVDDRPVEFETIDAITPIALPGGDYREIRITYHSDFEEFYAKAAADIAAARAAGESEVVAVTPGDMLLSVVPWFHFDSYTFLMDKQPETYVSVVVGKLENGLLPFSVKANHCFVHGEHFAQMVRYIEESCKGFSGKIRRESD